MTQQHLGVVAARNNAIKEAQGEFIYLLDSDDVVDKTVLEKEPLESLAKEGQLMSYMHRGYCLCTDGLFHLVVQPAGAEECMIHEIAEIIWLCRFAA